MADSTTVINKLTMMLANTQKELAIALTELEETQAKLHQAQGQELIGEVQTQ